MIKDGKVHWGKGDVFAHQGYSGTSIWGMPPGANPAAQDLIDSATIPQFLRAAGDYPPQPRLPNMTAESLRALTPSQSRMLKGGTMDEVIKNRLAGVLGTKWLMRAQECWYRAPRPAYAHAGAAAAAHPDVALLMVDNRVPVPYEVAGTTLRSPDAWGAPRRRLASGWAPAGKADGWGTFQLALVTNHIYAQLHGYTFYLENPCPTNTSGVDDATYRTSIGEEWYRERPFKESLRVYMNTDPVCPQLPASHRLGPFPPRGPPWTKIAALRYVLRRHAYLLYLDSDAYVTEVWQPLEPLLELTGLRGGGRWVAAAQEFPPQKLRNDYRAGVANSGILLMAGAPVAGAEMLRLIEEWIWPPLGVGNPTWMFKWPFEQNGLTKTFYEALPDRCVLLRPGCPINSPFGAFLRHFVGGTPHRAVYHHEHRHSWLLEALQCTLRIVEGGGAPERCTPNEPLLALDAAGCVEEASATDAMMDAVPAPGSGTSVVARLRASDSQACCALCNAADECTSWAFAFDYPMNVINCQLLAKFGAARHEKGHMIGHRRYAPRPKGARVGPRDARVAYVPPPAAYE